MRKNLAVTLSLVICGVLIIGQIALLPASAQETVNLFVAGRSEGWLPIIEAYERANPHVKIQFLAESGHLEYLEKIYVNIAAGDFPDVMRLDDLWMVDFAERDLLAPIPDDVMNVLDTALHPAALEAGEYRGVKYGISSDIQVMALYYNQRLLEEAGIGAPPATWDELATQASRLVTEGRTGLTVNGGGWGWTGNWFAVSRAFGATYATEDGTITLNDPRNVALLDMFVDWFGREAWATTDRNAFQRGEGYFGLSYPWWNGFLNGGPLGTAWKEQIKVAHMPAGPEGIGSYQYGWSWFVNKHSRHPEEAWKFVTWLMTEPVFDGLTPVGYYQAQGGSVPTVRQDAQAGLFAEDPALYQAFIDMMPYVTTEAKLPFGTERQNILAAAITAAIDGQKTSVQALSDARLEIENLLNR